MSDSIAVLGSGQAGVATLLNTIVEVAYATPDGVPRVKLVVMDTHEGDRPRAAESYPLNGLAPAEMHPFFQAEPPTGFQTFGSYVDEASRTDPGLTAALSAPTWGQVNAYLEQLLELAAISFAQVIDLEVVKTAVASVRERLPGGPATIAFVDGTELEVLRIVRGRTPPYLGGRVELPAGFLEVEVERTVTSSGLPIEKPTALGATTGFDLVFAIATGRIAVEAAEGSEAELEAYVRGEFIPRIRPAGIGELWIVTPAKVSDRLAGEFTRPKVRFVSLQELGPLTKRLSDAARHQGKS